MPAHGTVGVPHAVGAEPGPITYMLTAGSLVMLVISLLSHSPYAFCMMDDQKSDRQGLSAVHAVRAGPESGLHYLFVPRKSHAIILLSRFCIMHKEYWKCR